MHTWQGPPLSTYSCLRRHCGVDLAAAAYEVFFAILPSCVLLFGATFGTGHATDSLSHLRYQGDSLRVQMRANRSQGNLDEHWRMCCSRLSLARGLQSRPESASTSPSAAAAAATAASIWKELYIQSVGRLLQRLILRAGLLLGGRNKIASMEQLTSLGAYRQGAFPSNPDSIR
jgi:hypothetical protein